MKATLVKTIRARRRVRRVRKRVTGSPERPRLAVSRSHRHIWAQIIDDFNGRTLCAASSASQELRDRVGYGGNIKAATLVGQALGEKAKAQGIELVCFDRRGRRYHGRVKALADAAREAGLKF
ncbi:MAG: 50S ribosomal protein L18 [Planctomycetota bacterium]